MRIKTGQFQTAVVVQMFQSWFRLRLTEDFELMFHSTLCYYLFNPFLIVFLLHVQQISSPPLWILMFYKIPLIEKHRIYPQASGGEAQGWLDLLCKAIHVTFR